MNPSDETSARAAGREFPGDGNGLVLYQRRDRLGARLEGMLSAWRFARVTGRKLIVFWPDRNPPGSYHPALLFDLKAMEESGRHGDLSVFFDLYGGQYPEEQVIDLRHAPGWPFALRKRDFVGSRDKAVKIMTLHSTYFCFRWESPWRIARELRELFALLVPSAMIREALSDALAWIGDTGFIAVHIRRGDVIRDTKRKLDGFVSPGSGDGESKAAVDKLMKDEGLEKDLHNFVKRVTSLDAYIAAIPKDSRAKIVVFSDTPEAAAEFQARLPQSRPVLMSSFEADLKPAQRAYLELLVLSKASRVISTASCFSRLACQCGRPTFHDARNSLGAAGTRAAFDELFGGTLERSESLRNECARVLERELAVDRWSRMPDWVIARFPWLAWISLK